MGEGLKSPCPTQLEAIIINQSHRETRDIRRKLLGAENVTFLVMNLTKDCQKKRLAHRHGEDSDGSFAEMLSKGQFIYDICKRFVYVEPPYP